MNRRRLLFVTCLVLSLGVLGCRNASAGGLLPDDLTASAMLTGTGATHLAVTASWHVAKVDKVDLWADGLATVGGFGGGLSVPVIQVLQEVGIGETVSWLGPLQSIMEQLRGGLCIVHTGSSFSGGGYIIYPLWAKSF